MILKGDCIEVMKAMKPNSVLCVCAVCGKKFIRYKTHIKSKHQFCSSECSYKGRSLGYVKRMVSKPYKIVNSLKKRIKKNCEICGKDFETIPSKEKTNKYCSRKCFEIAHKENMRGKKNPSYINGNSYNKRSWRGFDWEERRQLVYKRDNYICQRCEVKCIGRKELNGNNSHRLIQCHHLEKYKINQINDLNKLITLCVSCHGQMET